MIKHLCNHDTHVLHNVLGSNINTSTFVLGPIKSSSPTTKELHALGNHFFKKKFRFLPLSIFSGPWGRVSSEPKS